MKKKLFVALILIVVVSTLTFSHEFWMVSLRFRYKLNDEMPVAFVSGGNFDGEQWSVVSNKIDKLELHHGLTVTDLKKNLRPAEKIKLKVRLAQEGTQLIIMQGIEKVAVQTADAFSASLKEAGQEGILHELADSKNSAAIRELVVRSSKMIFQVGSKTDDTYKKKTGLRLEIIPLQNPYVIRTGDYVDCLVIFEGKPLAHQLVKVFNKVGNASFLQDIYTENDGTIRFPVSAPGKWMVSTTKTVRPETPDADWQSIWSSTTFGI